MSQDKPTRRLFFALWPDEHTRALIAQRAAAISLHKSKPVAVENYHITLRFIGDVDASLQACIEAQAAHVNAAECELLLNQFGFFKRARVLWFGASDCPAGLLHLVEQLSLQLESCGAKLDSKAFVPHLTLARKVNKCPPLPSCEPMMWKTQTFCLIESILLPGQPACYQLVRQWPLLPPQA